MYPAIEVAKRVDDEGWEVLYIGSERGQEKGIAKVHNIEFQGFPAAPLYSLTQIRGWRSLIGLLKCSKQAKRLFRTYQPDVVFSTGGYAAAPAMSAARSLGIPLVIHESNSVPGRSNRMFSGHASTFTCAFEKTKSVIPKAIRTGQPIRKELREVASSAGFEKNGLNPMVLGLGGSQGSTAINKLIKESAARRGEGIDWLVAVGPSHYSGVKSQKNVASLKMVPYLDAEDLADAYQHAAVVVSRSGGTLAELAMFGIPSVLIPLPSSADDHQRKNAEEFVSMGGAKLLEQEAASAGRLISAVDEWLADEDKYQSAKSALRKWDRPRATEDILELVVCASKKN